MIAPRGGGIECDREKDGHGTHGPYSGQDPDQRTNEHSRKTIEEVHGLYALLKTEEQILQCVHVLPSYVEDADGKIHLKESEESETHQGGHHRNQEIPSPFRGFGNRKHQEHQR
jgi:hypothetical protein